MCLFACYFNISFKFFGSSISSLDNPDPPPKIQSSSPLPLRLCPARPDVYPYEVLWTYDDYKEECPDTLQFPGSVAFGIRHADGRQILQREWAAIVAVVKYVEYELLVQTNSRDVTGKLYRKADTSFYKWYHRAEWSAAVEKLEKVCPILGLCAYHWKAEMVLRWALQQPGDPHDPKMTASRPFGLVKPNVCQAEGRTDAIFMGGTPTVKRAREISFTDSYPNKKLPVWKPPLLPQLFQTASDPPISTALPTTSTSTFNISSQPSTTTLAQTSEETTRLGLETRLGVCIIFFAVTQRVDTSHYSDCIKPTFMTSSSNAS